MALYIVMALYSDTSDTFPRTHARTHVDTHVRAQGSSAPKELVMAGDRVFVSSGVDEVIYRFLCSYL